MKKNVFLLVISLLLSASTPPKMTWLALGDSITYLNDHADQTKNRITKGYMTMVVEKLPNMEFINKGYNGWTSGGIADKIEDLGLVKADVYSVFLGTNDWWQGRPVGTWEDYENSTGSKTVYGAFRVIINKLRSLNPEAKIVLITPMQRVDFVYLFNMKNNAFGSYKPKKEQNLEQFAEAIKDIAQRENLEVVDLFHVKKLGLKRLVKFKRLKNPQTNEYQNYPYPDFIDIPFNPETDEYPYPTESIAMTYDGLHPSDEGYEVIAKILVKIFKKYP